MNGNHSIINKMIKCFIAPQKIYNEDYYEENNSVWSYLAKDNRSWGFTVELPCLPCFGMGDPPVLALSEKDKQMVFDQLKEYLLNPCSGVSEIIKMCRTGKQYKSDRRCETLRFDDEDSERIKNMSNIDILAGLCGMKDENCIFENFITEGVWYMEKIYFIPNSEAVFIIANHEI